MDMAHLWGFDWHFCTLGVMVMGLMVNIHTVSGAELSEQALA